MIDLADQPPWEQRPGEGPKPYGAFLIYADQPPGARTINGAWRIRSGRDTAAPAFFRKWAQVWTWVDRAKAWDRERQQLDLAAEQRAVEDEAKRRLAEVRGFRRIVSAPMQEVLRRMAEGSLAMEELGQNTLIELALIGARIWPRLAVTEQLLLGEATERAATTEWTGPMPDTRADEEHQAAVFAALEETGWSPSPVVEGEVLELPPPREATG